VSYLLDCRLVGNKEIRPILGRKACLDMDIIQYNDNDSLNKPHTGNAAVFMVEPSPQLVLTEEILARFPSVFSDGVGPELSGEYKMRIDSNARPVQHSPRGVAVALRPKLRETLENLLEQDVIEQVTTPTPWISYVVVVPKKEWQASSLFRPECPEQRHPEGKLSATDDGGNRNPTILGISEAPRREGQDCSLKQQSHTWLIQFQWKFLLVTTSSNPTNLAFSHRICSHHRDHAVKSIHRPGTKTT